MQKVGSKFQDLQVFKDIMRNVIQMGQKAHFGGFSYNVSSIVGENLYFVEGPGIYSIDETIPDNTRILWLYYDILKLTNVSDIHVKPFIYFESHN